MNEHEFICHVMLPHLQQVKLVQAAWRETESPSFTSPDRCEFCCRRWSLPGECVWLCKCVAGGSFLSTSVPMARRFVFLLSWEAHRIIFSHLFHHSFPSSCYHLYSQTQWLFFPPPLHLTGFRWIDFPLPQRKSFMFAIVWGEISCWKIRLRCSPHCLHFLSAFPFILTWCDFTQVEWANQGKWLILSSDAVKFCTKSPTEMEFVRIFFVVFFSCRIHFGL